MSWDVLIVSERHKEDSEAEPPPLGEAEAVRTNISNSLPATDWSDPAWGVLEGDGWSIEFNFEKSGTVDSFMLHVRGGGDPVEPIAKLCRENGWHALDMTSGEYLNVTSPSRAGWRDFQSFRDGIVSQLKRRERNRRILFFVLPLFLAIVVVVLRRLL